MAETIIIRGLDENVEAFRRLGSEGRKRAGKLTLMAFFAEAKLEVLLAWEKIKARGGMFRGVHWDGFKPQYTRKDGTVVPAWGGVAKVSGVGTVQGKKRPSKQPVTEASTMMADTRNLQNVWNDPAEPVTDSVLHLGPGNRPGLPEGFVGAQNALRRFMFWTKKNEQRLPVLHLKYLKAEIERLFK